MALFNVEGTLYALDGICPRQGDQLGKGRLEAAIVRFIMHGWRFERKYWATPSEPVRCITLDLK